MNITITFEGANAESFETRIQELVDAGEMSPNASVEDYVKWLVINYGSLEDYVKRLIKDDMGVDA